VTNFGFVHRIIALSSFYVGPMIANLAFINSITPAADRAVIPYVPLLNLLNVLFLSIETFSLGPFFTCVTVIGLMIGLSRVLAAVQTERAQVHQTESKRDADSDAAQRDYDEQANSRARRQENRERNSHQRREEQYEQQRRTENEQQQEYDRGNRQSEPNYWWSVLEVSQDASLDEVRRKYYLLLKQYHPDRVNGLGPEFAALAENRTKALNAAWELAKREKRENTSDYSTKNP